MSVQTILDKIIKPQYRSKLNNWQQYAKLIDKFGLECINQIYNTKGTKKINPDLDVEKPVATMAQMTVTKTSFFGETDAKINMTKTSYQFFHSSSSVPKEPKQSIFQVKNLQQLKISRPLNPMTITFIESWLRLKDSKKYQQAVLNCLRSLSSKLSLADPHSTEMKQKYDGKSDWKLSKPVRMDKAGEDLFAFKPNLDAIEKQERKKLAHREKLRELEKTEFAKQMKIFKDFKIN